MAVKEQQKETSRWQQFIDNWTSPAFKQYVSWLGDTLDSLVKDKSDAEFNRLLNLFMTTARYEYLFWEMAVKTETWPV